MQKHIKRMTVLTIGIAFILLGILGLVLPVLQGILFLFIGFILLSLYFPEIRTWMDKHTRRYPKLHPIIEKADNWIKKFVGEI